MSTRAGIIIVALAAATVACGTTTRERKRAEKAVSARIDVEIIAREVMNDVQHTARHITNQTEDRELRRLMVVWQLNTLDYCRRAMLRPDPRLAFVDIWTLLEQTRAYAVSDDGKEVLGPEQPYATASLDGMIARIEQRAQSILTPRQFEQINAAIDEYVRQRSRSGDEIAQPPTTGSGADSALAVILAVPEGIISIGGGVKDTAFAINEVARAAEQGVAAVSAMPQMTRWQTELLVFSLEENPSVTRLLGDISRFSESVGKVANTAESLPATLEETSSRLIREVEQTQPEFRKTLEAGRLVVEETRATLKEVDPLLDRVEENGAWIDSASAKVTEAGTAWTGAFEQLNLLVHAPVDPRLPPPEPSPPFDMKDVVRTAEHATETAHTVRASVEDLRALVEGDAADRIEGAAGATIGRLTTSGVTLILTFFGALLVYRLVMLAVTRSRGATA